MEVDPKVYVSYFVSYLLNELNDLSNIKQIILFGSVAISEARKDSDIDIFVDINKRNEKLKNKIKKITEEFYKSREALLFKTRKIDNKINVIIGKLDEWKDLRNSIESTGIVLYGPYISSKVKGRKYTVFYWDKIEKNRGAFLNKVYGFKVKDKRYKGLIEELNGKKLGKSSVMIPVEHRNEIIKLLKKYRVNSKILEVYA
ncbi:MAG: nucleotidyltransferase domain-containing protein [Nanoarchaeota archaeon]|nr:nucleotidyltransferase domain-containing protein [Nanoarchaeota archaeon]